MKRNARAIWSGTGLEGKGSLTTQSGVFNDQPYNFKQRFENEDGKLGTNPEELIAAAHAGCYAMALSFQLVGAEFKAETLDVNATVHLEKGDDGFSITQIELKMKAHVPGISSEKFDELAQNAKKGCPISKALSAVPISLDYELKS